MSHKPTSVLYQAHVVVEDSQGRELEYLSDGFHKRSSARGSVTRAIKRMTSWNNREVVRSEVIVHVAKRTEEYPQEES